MDRITVVKFGGTSLASAEQIKKAAAIIKASPVRRYVVASAPGKRTSDDTKVTDLLYRCYDKAAAGEELSADIPAEEEFPAVDPAEELQAVKYAKYLDVIFGSGYEELGRIRWRNATAERNFIDKAFVDLMPDAGKNWHGELRDSSAKRFAVKVVQIGFGSASAYNADNVQIRNFLKPGESRKYGRFGFVALHFCIAWNYFECKS